MADSDSGSRPVGTDQNMISDGIVGDMCTVGAMPTVTSELFHVPSDKVVFLVANSGNELSFVSSQPEIDRMTSRPSSGSSSRLAGAHCAGSSSSESRGASTWRMNSFSHSGEPERTFRSTLEMEVAETRQMLSQQQVALTSLTDSL